MLYLPLARSLQVQSSVDDQARKEGFPCRLFSFFFVSFMHVFFFGYTLTVLKVPQILASLPTGTFIPQRTPNLTHTHSPFARLIMNQNITSHLDTGQFTKRLFSPFLAPIDITQTL